MQWCHNSLPTIYIFHSTSKVCSKTLPHQTLYLEKEYLKEDVLSGLSWRGRTDLYDSYSVFKHEGHESTDVTSEIIEELASDVLINHFPEDHVPNWIAETAAYSEWLKEWREYDPNEHKLTASQLGVGRYAR